MKGSFSLDAFDPEIISKKQGRYCAGNPRSLLLEIGIDGQCAGEKCGPRTKGNTMFEIGNTIAREKTGVRLTNAHRSEIAASRHLAY
jgi:hypothetical protein